ncbi:SusD/RagB family nutrient-binding outer membrane lipoprotein [Pararcticibacter amylolyticus]|uniref:SusD/RagB family nutrient-binding outer membrane lipoprotein n=1 Tax=Pararcticibacter amylolyticus TaxID=2173175 RepID=A0A2U2PMW7_9SPHI|nr:SusD/RagB family nutrient-binding outer membrane lipoprotein [Pararcticibacter amylolyticus]PWG82668.1 SusD/RagB family nutrient-binding outer membrane lipoprotein [Pararcticibacter amylolyticus]
MKKIKIYASVLLLLLSGTACKKALDINDNDPNYLKDTEAKFLLPSGLAYSASRVGGDFQLIGGFWSQHYTQNNNASQYRTLDQYNLTISSYNDTWSNMWSGALSDLKLAMQRASAKGEWHYYLAAEVMAAFDYHILNDFYGAIPVKEGLDFATYPQPKFDDSKVVNGIIISMLDDAISKASQASALDPMGKEDFIFNGDIENWVAFAKSLKLKILMRDFSTNQAAITTLLGDNLLAADAKMDVFIDAENKSNPLYEQDRRKLNNAGNMRASNTLLKYLLANQDPRIGAFYEKTILSSTIDPETGKIVVDEETGEPWPEYYGLEQGDYLANEDISQTSRAVIKPTDPVFFMSAAEVAFLKAEAYARLGNVSEAKTNYDRGVTLAFERWNSASLPLNAAPFLASGGKYEFHSTAGLGGMLEQIITQKWVAAARSQAWDSFFDQNRTGYPLISNVDTEDDEYVPGEYTIAVNSVLAAGKLPRRLLFPKRSSDYNPNTPSVVPITTPMWWHKEANQN